MTFALVLNVLMVITGAALFGWLVRWHTAQGSESVAPGEVARREAERAAAAKREQSV